MDRWIDGSREWGVTHPTPIRSLHSQRAQEARREAERSRLAVAVARRRSEARRTVAVAVPRPEVHAAQSLGPRVVRDFRDVAEIERLVLSVVAADHRRQLDLAVRDAVEVVQALRRGDR